MLLELADAGDRARQRLEGKYIGTCEQAIYAARFLTKERITNIFTATLCVLIISSFLFIKLMHNNIALKNVKIYIQIFIKMFLHVSVLTTIIREPPFMLC